MRLTKISIACTAAGREISDAGARLGAAERGHGGHSPEYRAALAAYAEVYQRQAPLVEAEWEAHLASLAT